MTDQMKAAAIPRHIAIIMDGNRRWATEHGLPKFIGHRHGIDALKVVVPALMKRGIPVATFFAFSRENWRRTKEEVSWLMGLFHEFMVEGVAWLHERGVRLRVSGRLDDFPSDLARLAEKAMVKTKTNNTMTVNMALSYGGREEIRQMVQRLAAETKGDPRAIETISEERISQNLYTAGLPDVDLLIRTGGEKRLSGFLPWQAVYAELYFTNMFWPDFNEAALDAALADYAGRKRNFGA